MTFVGIVIFMVWTNQTVTDLNSNQKHTEPYGERTPAYVGRFDSLKACQEAADKLVYKPLPGQRVDDAKEIICVPEFNTNVSAPPQTGEQK